SDRTPHPGAALNSSCGKEHQHGLRTRRHSRDHPAHRHDRVLRAPRLAVRRTAAAALLDLDGTLIDSNYQHELSWYRALVSHELRVPPPTPATSRSADVGRLLSE